MMEKAAFVDVYRKRKNAPHIPLRLPLLTGTFGALATNPDLIKRGLGHKM